MEESDEKLNFTRQDIEQHLQSALAAATPNVWSKLDLSVPQDPPRKLSGFVRLEQGVRRWGAAAACICLLAGGGIYHYEYRQVASVVNIDVNPSLKISLNRRDKVIKAEALNPDGEAVLEGELRGETLETALGQVVDSLVEKGYLKEGEQRQAVLVSVSGKDEKKTEQVKTEATANMEAAIAQNQVSAVVYDQTIQVTRELEELAEVYQVSVGKAGFVEQLVQENEALNQDAQAAYAWMMNQSMEAIAREISENEYLVSEEVNVVQVEPVQKQEDSREHREDVSGAEPVKKSGEGQESAGKDKPSEEEEKDDSLSVKPQAVQEKEDNEENTPKEDIVQKEESEPQEDKDEKEQPEPEKKPVKVPELKEVREKVPEDSPKEEMTGEATSSTLEPETAGQEETSASEEIKINLNDSLEETEETPEESQPETKEDAGEHPKESQTETKEDAGERPEEDRIETKEDVGERPEEDRTETKEDAGEYPEEDRIETKEDAEERPGETLEEGKEDAEEHLEEIKEIPEETEPLTAGSDKTDKEFFAGHEQPEKERIDGEDLAIGGDLLNEDKNGGLEGTDWSDERQTLEEESAGQKPEEDESPEHEEETILQHPEENAVPYPEVTESSGSEEGAILQEPKEQEVTGQEAENQEVTGQEAENQEVTGQEAENQEVTGQEAENQEVTGQEAENQEINRQEPEKPDPEGQVAEKEADNPEEGSSSGEVSGGETQKDDFTEDASVKDLDEDEENRTATQIIRVKVEKKTWKEPKEPVFASQFLGFSHRRLLSRGPGAFDFILADPEKLKEKEEEEQEETQEDSEDGTEMTDVLEEDDLSGIFEQEEEDWEMGEWLHIGPGYFPQ